ncbi:hypothetical protein COLO4_25051 [Corchorus olitorius]|uniref:Uncharacterized protein n=1 Tax=Corchorus olitorius TaxID=93759 RepID=A0A1R3I4Y4_9ROSI|nr:hypothetical protein COLO4_25051 [Corchorus olitorius]
MSQSDSTDRTFEEVPATRGSPIGEGRLAEGRDLEGKNTNTEVYSVGNNNGEEEEDGLQDDITHSKVIVNQFFAGDASLPYITID